MNLDELIDKRLFHEIPNYLACADNDDDDKETRQYQREMEVKSTDPFLRTPLHRICEQGGKRSSTNTNDLMNAIESVYRIYPNALYEIDEDGRTPLHCACIATPNVEPKVIQFILTKSKTLTWIPPPETTTKTGNSAINSDPKNKNSAIELVRKFRTRGQRNTPLHELCRWGNWSSITLTSNNNNNNDTSTSSNGSNESNNNDDNNVANSNNSINTIDEDPELQVLQMLLEVDPLGGLMRNRAGITPLYLVFGRHYSNHQTTNNNNTTHTDNNDIENDKYLNEIVFNNHPTIEFQRRWNAVKAIIRYAANANTIELLNNHNDDDEFLYLHATLNVDRTYPIFDIIIKKYGIQQSRIKGTEQGLRYVGDTASNNHENGANTSTGDDVDTSDTAAATISSNDNNIGNRSLTNNYKKMKISSDDKDHTTTAANSSSENLLFDYPLVIAARSSSMSSYYSNRVIQNLIALYPDAARIKTSSGRTVLLEAVRSGKGFQTSNSINSSSHKTTSNIITTATTNKNIQQQQELMRDNNCMNTNDFFDNSNTFINNVIHDGSALGNIIKAYPEAISIQDIETNLYPFMEAARIDTDLTCFLMEPTNCKYNTTSGANPTTNTISKDSRRLDDIKLFILNNTYILLRMAPDLAIPVPVEEGVPKTGTNNKQLECHTNDNRGGLVGSLFSWLFRHKTQSTTTTTSTTTTPAAVTTADATVTTDTADATTATSTAADTTTTTT